MAWRAIQDTVGRAESLAAVSDLAERLYWRLLAHSDTHGRLAASPAKLRALCWPLLPITDRQAGAALLELARVERIYVYETPDGHVLELARFEENQATELLRKRGKPTYAASPDKGALTPDASGLTISTIYKTPANQHHSGLRAETSGQRPQRVEKSREEKNSSSSNYVARANPHPATDADRAAAALEELGLTLDAGADPARVLAWCELARTAATSNPAGFVRSGMASGAWPSPRSSPAENGSRPRRAIAEVVRDIIRNVGAELDEHAFVAEVRQLEQRRGETIGASVALELLEEWRKVARGGLRVVEDVSQSPVKDWPGSDDA